MTKFYRLGWSKDEYDEKYDAFWRGVDPVGFAHMIKCANNNKAPARFRFAVCGEIWNDLRDVKKVARILKELPRTLFWIPTRAWHSSKMVAHIERHIFPLKNARVMASVDTDTTPEQFEYLKRRGWSMVFAGDNSDPNQLLLAEGGVQENVTASMHRCEKTWDEASGHCAKCGRGCFSRRPSSVHLRRHR